MLDHQFSIAICGKYNRDAYGEPALEVPSDWYQIYIVSHAVENVGTHKCYDFSYNVICSISCMCRETKRQ